MVVAVRDEAFVLEVDKGKYVAFMDWQQSLHGVKWVDVAKEAELALSNMPSHAVVFGPIHTYLRSLEITPLGAFVYRHLEGRPGAYTSKPQVHEFKADVSRAINHAARLRPQSRQTGIFPLRIFFCEACMSNQPALQFVFYFAAPPETVWEGFVSPESNRIIFGGAEFLADLKPGGLLQWVGPGPDGKRTVYVRGEVVKVEPPRLLQYTYSLGQSALKSRVTVELVPETEATQVSVTHDLWAENDPAYALTASGWPRVLSRLKTLIETGKTFKPH